MILGSKVVVTSTATEQVRSANTDAAGAYTFPSLPVGDYVVTVSTSGFATVRNTGVTISVGTTTRLNVSLPVASAQEAISVQAQVDLINTSNAESGGVFVPMQVTNLPMDGRNFLTW